MKLNLIAIASLAGDKKALAAISEDDFSHAVREYATAHSWKVYFAAKTGGFAKDGKTWLGRAVAGFPDLFLLRESDRRSMALELKTQKGRPTAAQLEWVQAMSVCRIEADVVRPSDAKDLIDRLGE